MMEHPSTMFAAKNCLKISHRLSVLAVATVLASCSLNPWADDDEARAIAEHIVQIGSMAMIEATCGKNVEPILVSGLANMHIL